jgi:type II secretory pathway pseudopilin PulG
MNRLADGNRGYAMAALLVGMSVMAVLMGALLPVWTHMATREKEAELVFRGQQYARAIGLFQRKFANTPPPTIDVLVEQRFLRKKYKDPITKEDFQPIYANQAAQAVSAPLGAQRPGQTATSTPEQPRGMIQAGFGSTGATGAGGIIGVTSKSKAQSIRIYNGRDRYNEWAFVYVQTVQRPGQPGAPGQAPGFQGAPGQRPGMRPGANGLPPGMQPGMMQPGMQPGMPGPFGMPQGSFPQGPGGQRFGAPMQPGTMPFPQPGTSQPTRPPVVFPGQQPPTRPPGQ